MSTPAAALPFHASAADSAADAIGIGAAGLGIDDFALYAALRDLSRATGIVNDYLVAWPWNPAIDDSFAAAANTVALTAARLFLVPQIVRAGQPFDGVMWIQQTAGVFTAANENKVAAYTFSGGQLVRLAQSASVGALWKAAAGVTVQAFTAQAPAFDVDTLVWAAGLWNQSALTTTPAIWGATLNTSSAKRLNLGNFALSVDVAAQATMPATIALAALNQTFTNRPWLGLYRHY